MQYKIVSQVIINTEKLEVGSLVDFTDEQATPLLKEGAIELAAKPYEMAALNLNITN